MSVVQNINVLLRIFTTIAELVALKRKEERNIRKQCLQKT